MVEDMNKAECRSETLRQKQNQNLVLLKPPYLMLMDKY